MSCIAKHFKTFKLSLVKCKTKLQDITAMDKIQDITNNYHVIKTNHRGIQKMYEKSKINITD